MPHASGCSVTLLVAGAAAMEAAAPVQRCTTPAGLLAECPTLVVPFFGVSQLKA